MFIVTYGRSGSTLLQRVLQTIPNSCIRGENNGALFPLFIAWRKLSTAKNKYGKNRTFPKQPWWGIDRVKDDVFGRRLAQVFIDTVIRPPAGTRLLGFKEIRYHEAGNDLPEFLEFLKCNFPEPNFIFLTRNLDDVTKSGWWAKLDETQVRNSLSRAETAFRNFVAANQAASFALTFEEVIQRDAKLLGLFEFLGENLDQAAVDAVFSEKLSHAPRAP